jgi:general secretion pathway protein H
MTGQRAQRRPGEKGFTLLEMLIVLCVMALAAAFAMPFASRPVPDAALIATAHKLANDMRLARASAIRDNAERVLTIDLGRRLFWVDGVTSPSPIAGGVTVEFATLQKEQISAKRGQLRFFPDGSSTGGNVVLRGSGRTVAIRLDWMTGHASLRRSR